MTLACEDGTQVEAHKVILVASSPFFKDILKRHKHPHPLIYMRGLKSEDLLAITDFLYFGEAKVLQENLDSFLALAEELRLKGLTGTDNSDKAREPKAEVEKTNKRVPEEKAKTTKKHSLSNLEQRVVPLNQETALADNSSDLHNLDEQIKSMMTITNVRPADGHGFLAKCNICGKQSPSRNMLHHIEANHITGVSHSCDICGKVSRSRHALTMHKRYFHKTLLQDQKWLSYPQVYPA